MCQSKSAASATEIHFRHFLRPFVCILGLVGLRPNAVDRDLATLLGHLQSITVLALLLAGYVLQYLSGFRRSKCALENFVEAHAEEIVLQKHAKDTRAASGVSRLDVLDPLHLMSFYFEPSQSSQEGRMNYVTPELLQHILSVLSHGKLREFGLDVRALCAAAVPGLSAGASVIANSQSLLRSPVMDTAWGSLVMEIGYTFTASLEDCKNHLPRDEDLFGPHQRGHLAQGGRLERVDQSTDELVGTNLRPPMFPASGTAWTSERTVDELSG
ncbi:hypothetical protein pipiens_005311 [Culex pipiens pipiens]|uniref:Uncharacterized protein n=1 Tax=Culex pipiens pipiens TaxID=38569 RepID=A0ABD1DXT5_CULPP